MYRNPSPQRGDTTESSFIKRGLKFLYDFQTGVALLREIW